MKKKYRMYSCRFWGEEFKYEVNFQKKALKKHSKINMKILGVVNFTAPYLKSAKTNLPPTNVKMLSKTS